jgi:hypothetical protein
MVRRARSCRTETETESSDTFLTYVSSRVESSQTNFRVESSRVRPTSESSRVEFDSTNSTFLKIFSASFTCFLTSEVIIVSSIVTI